ncbi:hypothetical protein UCRPC4_g04479 [Phaeomoniella chlamydospora]|uniref:Rrn9 domain-containing protein n=1 Tax=Phaeomoniella chlamydospora TaxID=158046 RepID=A0A0G2EB16_PHACM|nr:hypothetical protein UCRPC4_g04479 [Phaeomoniella chlamydospora]
MSSEEDSTSLGFVPPTEQEISALAHAQSDPEESDHDPSNHARSLTSGEEDEYSDSYFESNKYGAGMPVRFQDKGKGKAVPMLETIPTVPRQHAPYRPNRFYGPEQTWNNWSRQDRGAYESLIAIRDADLSAHLFNAHALELRERRATSDLDEGNFAALDMTFAPTREWTSWPLPPSEVPRGSFKPIYDKTDDSTYANLQEVGLREDLEDCLLSVFLRVAKERFESRQWEDEDSQNEEQGPAILPVQQKVQAAESLEENAMPTFSSQRFRDGDSDSELDNSSESEKAEQRQTSMLYDTQGSARPVFLADEDRARELLSLSLGETISRFETVLEGLHQTQQMTRSSDAQSGHDDNDKDLVNIKTSLTAEIMRPYFREAQKVRRRRKHDIEEKDKDPNSRESSANRIPGTPPEKRLEPDRRRRRDWSDVLAVAAIKNWDPIALERAAKRCAELFNEDMNFRTFYEGDILKNEPSFFTEATAAGFEPDENEALDAYVPPHWSSTEPSASEVETENGHTTDGSILGAEVSGKSLGLPNDQYRCPYQHRRRRDHVFNSARMLNQHIREHHRIWRSADLSSSTDLYMSEMTTGDESDAPFNCPVRACRKFKIPFKSSTNLYQHIRRSHPEVDVAEVKRLERARRGDQRGSYDRSKVNRKSKSSKRHPTQDESDDTGVGTDA